MKTPVCLAGRRFLLGPERLNLHHMSTRIEVMVCTIWISLLRSNLFQSSLLWYAPPKNYNSDFFLKTNSPERWNLSRDLNIHILILTCLHTGADLQVFPCIRHVNPKGLWWIAVEEGPWGPEKVARSLMSRLLANQMSSSNVTSGQFLGYICSNLPFAETQHIADRIYDCDESVIHRDVCIYINIACRGLKLRLIDKIIFWIRTFCYMYRKES